MGFSEAVRLKSKQGCRHSPGGLKVEGGAFQTGRAVRMQRQRDGRGQLGPGYRKRGAGVCATHQSLKGPETQGRAGGPTRSLRDTVGFQEGECHGQLKFLARYGGWLRKDREDKFTEGIRGKDRF